jgi:uncharacterized membrane protein YhaH (DUF805 family)
MREEAMDGMAGVHFWNPIVILISLFLVVFPIAKILQRTGYSGWWSIAFVIPIVGFVALWLFAYADWPSLPKVRKADA